MRENTLPPTIATLRPPQQPLSAATEVDADFLRHSRALASQVVMTRAEVLQCTPGGSSALSHW